MRLNAERRWWLEKWERSGWHIGDPMRASVKKWRAHTEALIKGGLLETIEPRDSADIRTPMCRITDAGIAALSPSTNGAEK